MWLKSDFNHLCAEVALCYARLTKDEPLLKDQRLLEPYLHAVLCLVKANPEHRTVFETCFQELVEKVDFAYTQNGKLLASLILRYCMRDLKWPIVLDAIISRVRRERNLSIKEMLMNITLVYQDEWPEGILWKYYAS
jgi:hypothetical protein